MHYLGFVGVSYICDQLQTVLGYTNQRLKFIKIFIIHNLNLQISINIIIIRNEAN